MYVGDSDQNGIGADQALKQNAQLLAQQQAYQRWAAAQQAAATNQTGAQSFQGYPTTPTAAYSQAYAQQYMQQQQQQQAGSGSGWDSQQATDPEKV